MGPEAVSIVYRNHKGLVSERNIVPESIEFTSTEYHEDKQWILTAWDYSKCAIRHFAMVDILEWKPVVKTT